VLKTDSLADSRRPLPTPPVVSHGLPWLGHTLEFYRNQEGLFRRGYQDYGEVFTIQLMGQPMAILVGSEQHEFFFKQTDKALDMEKPYEFLAAMFGKIAFLGPHEQYLLHRPVLHSLFGREQMVAYLGIMSRVIQGWLESLGDEGVMDISAEMVNIVKEVAGRCFLGDQVHERLEAAGFWTQYDVLSASLDPLLYRWPLPKFKRRDLAKKRIREILQPLIEERRRQPVVDGFQHLLEQPDAAGQPLPDDVIASFFSALMFAGHETTAGQAAWSVIHLAHDGAAKQQASEEARRVLGGSPAVDHSQMRELKFVAAAVQESGRMRPSAETLFREVKEDVTVKGYRIPKGWFVMTSTAAAHFLPDAYRDPFDYNPARFLEGGEGKGFNYISFGGGMHKCTGINFASAEMAIIVALLFSHFQVELVTPLEKIRVQRTGSSRPDKAFVRYKRI
jgi:sterol 14-demethylase